MSTHVRLRAAASNGRTSLTAYGAAGKSPRALEQSTLQPQQPLLAVEAAAVADEAAARSDDPMAGEDDRDRVAVHHRAHGPRRARGAHLRRQRAVRRRQSVLDTA